jgi:hypothetical protein
LRRKERRKKESLSNKVRQKENKMDGLKDRKREQNN